MCSLSATRTLEPKQGASALGTTRAVLVSTPQAENETGRHWRGRSEITAGAVGRPREDCGSWDLWSVDPQKGEALVLGTDKCGSPDHLGVRS